MRILLIDIDSVNPNHLGCYGYHRNTSPNIDKVAREGARFNNYYTTDAPCAPSRTALMTGQFGIHNGLVGHGGTAGDVRHEGKGRDFKDRLVSESLPGFLRTAGLKTVLISPFAERHSTWKFYAGFNEVYNTGKSGMELADEVNETALNWVENHAQDDHWFMYINYWDPHGPYRTSEEFGNPFEDEALPSWFTEDLLEKHKKKVGPHSVNELNMFDNQERPGYPNYLGEIKDMKDLKVMIDHYDCGIRHTDDHIGKLFQALETQGVMEDLVIIVTADHGENMGELGIYAEHGTADQATCRVPMIIRWPGKKPHVDNGLHYHIDLGPTLADMLGKEPSKQWDGRSYAPALDGGDCGRDYLIVSQCAHVCQRSVRFDKWIYIRTYHDGYHLFDHEMLFDLENDPYEQENVAKQHQEVCKDAVYYLNQWHDAMMQSMDDDVDPLWTVMKEGGPYHAKGQLSRYIEHLNKTDRGHAVPELIRRHPREFS